ncbi:MAG: SPFH domain-containing protein [Bacteroidetes bacterium]|nr:SPFH domain-containing protein [Bacteroidota bacterium]
MTPIFVLLLVLAATLFFTSFVTIQQGTVAVTTVFGKYKRILQPGLNLKIPIIEKVFKKISVQNRSAEMGFQAVTIDQANVNFTAMLLYAVFNTDEQTIKNVAFKFIDEKNLMQALVRSVEGSVRAFVATKKQSEVLQLRRDIVLEIKDQLDKTLEEWGYHLIDLQLNDITFDEEVIRSMAKVVASNNLKAAAENEGQALLITKTKAAEAEGNAIKIAAQAEKDAAQLRGQGVALFREEVARGMSQSAKLMQDANLDASLILFSMWTEAVKNFAEHGKGNVIFLDGSTEGMQQTIRQMMAISRVDVINHNK